MPQSQVASYDQDQELNSLEAFIKDHYVHERAVDRSANEKKTHACVFSATLQQGVTPRTWR